MKKLFTILLLVLSIGVLVACGETEGPQVTYYTVTFDTAGGNTIENQEVRNGGKVTKPADPVKDGFIFTGVWKNGNFTWDFDIDIVVNDMTLVAQWLEI